MRLHVLILCVLGLVTSCDTESYFYSGDSYVMFSDSVAVFGIDGAKKENFFEVQVGVTDARPYDRHYAIEVNTAKSNAIEGFHFDIVNCNVLIKSGEQSGSIMLKGNYDNIPRFDSLGICLQLVVPETEILAPYGNEMKITFAKCYPFDIRDFVGHVRMYATFPYGSYATTFHREAVLKNDSTIVLQDLFQRFNPVELLFSHKEGLDDLITVKEQDAFTDINYGSIRLRGTTYYPSYYNSADKFFILYLESYSPMYGSFGVYEYIFKMLTDDEYELEKNEVPDFPARI
ncbi:MAG: DUF4984 domain-containing protein [Bacteroidales bacterium]